MKKDVIALVGAGKGGKAILETLVNLDGLEIRYIYDTNPDAPGIVFARQHDITCLTDASYSQLAADNDVDLILEVTGKQEVFTKLRDLVSPKGIVIGSAGTKIIFHLLEAQHNITCRLEDLTEKLEQKIIERTEDIEDANRKLHNKILEHEALNKKLQRTIDEKIRYLLQATHQLKAPFAAIQSYVDIIIDGYAGDNSEQTIDIMHKIKKRCDLLSRSIKEMLELAKLQTCSTENIEMENIAINDAIQDTIRKFDIIAERRNIEIVFKPFDDNLRVRCNAAQTRTLLSILLDNAINYSNDNTSIEITGILKKDRPVVSIKDNGIGIPEKKLDKIFEEFFRTNDAAKKHTNGSGLGLSIAREVAKLNGFRLSVESEVGKGTEFTVAMQRCKAT